MTRYSKVGTSALINQTNHTKPRYSPMRILDFLVLALHTSFGYCWVSGAGWREKQVVPLFRRSVLRLRSSAPLHRAAEHSMNNNQPSMEPNEELKASAMALLDCLTSPRDPNDPQYDVEKDIRRDNLLIANDYTELKSALRMKGLRTSGDKLEMITRLLLDAIDPSIKYDELSGVGTNLKYIDKEDLSSEKVRVRTAAERAQDSEYNVDPDADDMGVLKSRSPQLHSEGAQHRLVMDGLSRKEVQFSPVRVRRTEAEARAEDYVPEPGVTGPSRRSLDAYVVVGKDVLRSWARTASAVVLLPSEEHPWVGKEVRVLADELAFAMQAVVIVPNMSHQYHGEGDGLDATSQMKVGQSLSKKQPSRLPAAVSDDVVAAMQYVRTDFGARTLCLAGVGSGAGVALELACDLYDLGRAAQYSEIEKILRKPGEENSEEDLDCAVQAALRRTDAEHHAPVRKVLQTGRSVFLKQRDVAPVVGIVGDAENGDSIGSSQVQEAGDETESMSGESDESGDGDVEERNPRSLDELLQTNRAAARAMEAEVLVQEGLEDWALIQQSAARARERKLMAPFATFYPHEMTDFVPRAILALQPEKFDVDRVADELVAPAFVVLDDGAAEKVTGDRLQKGFSNRASDIVDYCIRHYQGTGKGFAVRPSAEHEAKCAQEAVSMGALWLEAFCGHFEDGLPDGFGGTKFSSEAYRVVEKDEIVNPLRPSAVAAYLHDEPTLFQ